MKTKQRTYEGNYSYRDCEVFVEGMDKVFDIQKVVFKKIPHKDSWVTKWRVRVFYKE